MSTLILELSDEQIQKLARVAQQRGTSIQALMTAVINNLAAASEGHNVYDVTQDPIYHIKPHETGAPSDLSQQADHYLYGARER